MKLGFNANLAKTQKRAHVGVQHNQQQAKQAKLAAHQQPSFQGGSKLNTMA